MGGTSIFIVTVAAVFALGIRVGDERQSAKICTEIQWQSPTCQKEKEERLKP